MNFLKTKRTMFEGNFIVEEASEEEERPVRAGLSRWNIPQMTTTMIIG